MTRFYKVLKDHPLWEKGTIVSNEGGDTYKAISDIFIKELSTKFDFSNYSEGSELTENQPEWFERVYQHKLVGSVKYLAKDQALKLHKEIYKEK